MRALVNAPVGTEDTWLYRQERYPKTQTLMVASKRYENFILNVATDISEVKNNEERLFSILNCLPSIIEKEFTDGKRRGAYQEITDLIHSLNLDMNGEREKSSPDLVAIEVISKQALAKYSRLERDIFIEENSIIARLNKLETRQTNDEEDLEKFVGDKEQIQKLASLAELVNNIPGGKKTIIIVLIVIQLLGSFTIDIIIRTFGISQFIPGDIKELLNKDPK
jgi:hypothetical protein